MTMQQLLLGLGGAQKLGWIMTFTHDGHANADWYHYANDSSGYNTQSKNCYKGVTGDDSTGIWFAIASRQDPLTWNGSVDHINGCSNIFKIDKDGTVLAKCAMGGGGWNYYNGTLFVNDQEKLIRQGNYSADCLSLSGTTFTHHWSIGNGLNAQGHSNAPINTGGDGWANESVGYYNPHPSIWHWTASDKLWYWTRLEEQSGYGRYYGNCGPLPVNVSTGAWDTNYSGGGNYIALNYASAGPNAVQTVNSRTYFSQMMWYVYNGGGNWFRGNGLFRYDTAATNYSNSFTGPHSSSNHEWQRLITYAPGNWSYSNSPYDNNYFYMWVHDTGSSEKLYIGGKKHQYSNTNSNSYAGNWANNENNFVGKLGDDDNQFDWCSNLHGGSTSTYGSESMDSDGGDDAMGGVMSVRPDGNGNCISVHASKNHVVSNKNEILIAKWNDSTGALISVYGIACITSGHNFPDFSFGRQKGCLTTGDAVYIRIYTEGHKPVILKLPLDIGSLAGNHSIGGLTFTIGAANGVTQGNMTKDRIGFAEDGYNPYYNDDYDHSRDNMLSSGGNNGYGFSNGTPSITRSHTEI